MTSTNEQAKVVYSMTPRLDGLQKVTYGAARHRVLALVAAGRVTAVMPRDVSPRCKDRWAQWDGMWHVDGEQMTDSVAQQLDWLWSCRTFVLVSAPPYSRVELTEDIGVVVLEAWNNGQRTYEDRY